ncbi:MAG TPA: hypothetical protein VKF15_03615 [Nitrososphaerales archaeon]|nr:hypothetical protein [Nitrososphaerales archaeon]
MELFEGEGLRRRMLESYARNPNGWDFVMSHSPSSGFVDALVSGPESTWMLKIDSLFKPLPTVLGAQADVAPRRPASAFPYGFRKLPSALLLELLGREGGIQEPERSASLLSILRSETVVPKEGSSYAQGPFILTGPGMLGLSEGQRELDDRLTSEMRRFLRIRYPAYG